MREHWLKLDCLKQSILILHGLMAILFIFLYCTYGRQEVLRYEETYLKYESHDNIKYYTGKVEGRKTEIIVSGDYEVTIRSEDTFFGPYTIIFDDSFVPDEELLSVNISDPSNLKGVEVRKGDISIFRGAYEVFSDMLFIIDSNGEYLSGGLIITTGYDMLAGSKEPKEPNINTILTVAILPEMDTRGEVSLLCMGLFISICCIITVLFADELFRYHLSFRIQNAEEAEPSEWELASRWIGWIVLTVLAVVSYILGLIPIN